MKVNGKLIFLIYVSLNKFEISIYKNISQQLLYYKNTVNICIIYMTRKFKRNCKCSLFIFFW
jgi:hypothetical protein